MKISRACSGTLSSKTDDCKFFKTEKTYNALIPQFQGSWNCFISLNQFVVDQKHERTVAKEQYYIFSKILKFRCW